jgi:glycosyltransferase involved in cell wall biosynthesis
MKLYRRKITVRDQKWVDGRVVPTDWPDEMVRLYHEARGFLQVSRNEGLANCLLEAMSCGLPVIATPAGLTPLIVHPRCIVTDSKHVVNALRDMDDQRYAEEMGRFNREIIVKTCKWSMRREPYLEFFESCLP